MLVVDPFAGVATVGVQVASRGMCFAGIEAHAEIAELATLKFRITRTNLDLVEVANSIVDGLRPGTLDGEAELICSSFDEKALGLLVAIRERVQEAATSPWYLHLKWSLLAALRDCAGVKVGWPYQRPAVARRPRDSSPVRSFLRRIEWMAEDLHESEIAGRGRVVCGDARLTEPWNEIGAPAMAVVSSPPYLNNYDYADATRLEVYFWGTARTWRELTTRIRAPMIAGSTQQTSRPASEAAKLELRRHAPNSAEEILALESALAIERAARPRGKEYDQLVVTYFRDLTLALVQVRGHTVEGAPVRLVLGDSAPYGVYVDTPGLIAKIAGELGFESEPSLTLRTRGQRWHSNGIRHAIPLSEKLLRMRSQGGGEEAQETVG